MAGLIRQCDVWPSQVFNCFGPRWGCSVSPRLLTTRGYCSTMVCASSLDGQFTFVKTPEWKSLLHTTTSTRTRSHARLLTHHLLRSYMGRHRLASTAYDGQAQGGCSSRTSLCNIELQSTNCSTTALCECSSRNHAPRTPDHTWHNV